MKDIENRGDIETLVNIFYDAVKQDAVIGHIFNDIIGNDWSHHLPIMYSFWEMVLLSNPGYNGNPVKKHVEIDKKIPLLPEHFHQWILLWTITVDSLFAGPVADDAKKRASLMLDLIQFKINAARQGNSLF